MARRPHEREAAAVDRLERDPGGEQRSVPRRLRGDRVGVELRRAIDAAEQRDVFRGVRPDDLFLGRAPVDRRPGQDEQPLLQLGVRTRRMQPRELGVRQELDVASSVRSRAASRASPQSSVSAAARPQVGRWSSSGGSGAVGSIVAMRR